jgi:cytochrome c peroxidase
MSRAKINTAVALPGLWLLAVGLVGCGGSSSVSSTTGQATASAAALAGKALFFDTSLSASGKQACGTCHVPSRAYTADPATDKGLPVPLGGPNMDQTGFRNAPSLVYASFTPPFTLSGGPVGGFFRDGRASSLAAQAQQPFVTAFEMANADAAAVVAKLQNSPTTLAAFVAAYGTTPLSDPDAALADIGAAIAAYETEDPSFHPFSSKYDYWLGGEATLTTSESNGLALFNNPGKGNCTACHPSQAQSFSEHALFTDFSFDNIGVPRNWKIPANNVGSVSPVDGAPFSTVLVPVDVPDAAEYPYYDMGLCGPFKSATGDVNARVDLADTTSMCGIFKVPTLRNIAVTSPYFHNGVFTDLQQHRQQPEPGRGGLRRQSVCRSGHVLHGCGRCPRSVRIQRPAGAVRRQRQYRGSALHAAHLWRWPSADADRSGNRRRRRVFVHPNRWLRPDEPDSLQRSCAMPAQRCCNGGRFKMRKRNDS